jgi:hypothetical protein
VSIFGDPKEGTWWLKSKNDPRWNKTSRGFGLVTESGPGELGSWLKECRKKFGRPPDDCECGFAKD